MKEKLRRGPVNSPNPDPSATLGGTRKPQSLSIGGGIPVTLENWEVRWNFQVNPEVEDLFDQTKTGFDFERRPNTSTCLRILSHEDEFEELTRGDFRNQKHLDNEGYLNSQNQGTLMGIRAG